MTRLRIEGLQVCYHQRHGQEGRGGERAQRNFDEELQEFLHLVVPRPDEERKLVSVRCRDGAQRMEGGKKRVLAVPQNRREVTEHHEGPLYSAAAAQRLDGAVRHPPQVHAGAAADLQLVVLPVRAVHVQKL